MANSYYQCPSLGYIPCERQVTSSRQLLCIVCTARTHCTRRGKSDRIGAPIKLLPWRNLQIRRHARQSRGLFRWMFACNISQYSKLKSNHRIRFFADLQWYHSRILCGGILCWAFSMHVTSIIVSVLEIVWYKMKIKIDPTKRIFITSFLTSSKQSVFQPLITHAGTSTSKCRTPCASCSASSDEHYQ